MKKFYLFSFIIWSLLASFQLSAQGWQWGRTSGSTQYKHTATSGPVITDLSGNIYVSGNNIDTGRLFFGTDTIPFATTISYVVVPQYPIQLVLAKYDSSGNVLWAFGSRGWGNVLDMATDKLGNLYVYGNFEVDTLQLGPYILTMTITTYRGNPVEGCQYFIAKFDPSGSILWAKKVCKAYGASGGGEMGLDSNGNIYLAGTFIDSSTSFGNDIIYNKGVFGYTDIFLAKYTSWGDYL